jgi:site-specific recombinase XerD
MSNPFKGLWKIKRGKKIPENIPKEKEMSKLLEALLEWNGMTTFAKKRMYKLHVIGELMYSTGLRIAEVASLKEEDIDFTRGVVWLKEGKGGKKRVCFLNEYAKELLGEVVHQKDEKARVRRFIPEGRYALPRMRYAASNHR